MKKFHLTQSLRFFVKASTVASSSISAALWCSTSWWKTEYVETNFFEQTKFHLSINGWHCKEQVYRSLVGGENLPNLKNTQNGAILSFANLGGRKGVQHGDRGAHSERAEEAVDQSLREANIFNLKIIIFLFFLQNVTDHECDGEAEHGAVCPPGTKPRVPTDNQPEINYFLNSKRGE